MKRIARYALFAACTATAAVAAAEPCDCEDPDNPGVCLCPRDTPKPVPASKVDVVVTTSTPANVETVEGALLCKETKNCQKRILLRKTEMRLKVSAKGFETQEVTVGRATQWKAQSVTLRKCPSVAIRVEPPGALVRVGGAALGTAGELRDVDAAPLIANVLHLPPKNDCPLDKRRIVLGVEHADYAKVPTRELDTAYGEEPAVLAVEMKRLTGTLLVSSAVGDVDVYVSDELRGSLPRATHGNVLLEIPALAPGSYKVRLALHEEPENLSPRQVWGAFPNEKAGVRVLADQVTTADFQLPDAATRPANPALFTARREQLREQCEMDADSCVAYGWALRWGVGGPVDNAAATAAFDEACSKGTDKKEQGCTAYRWMLATGKVAPPSSPPDLPVARMSPGEVGFLEKTRFDCRSNATFENDPITPCVRAHLSPAAQREADPTAWVDRTPGGSANGIPLYVSGGYGADQRMTHVGYGFSAGAVGLSLDMAIELGYSAFKRWNIEFTEQEWKHGFGGALAAGVAIQPMRFFYFVLHGRFGAGGVSIAKEQAAFGAVLGGRAALGFTLGSAARRRLFAEAGAAFEGLGPDLVQPTASELGQHSRTIRSLEPLDRHLARVERQRWGFAFTPMVSLGWVF